MTNTMSCGCEIISDNLGAYKIEYCPKHRAADDMYEALKYLTKILKKEMFGEAMLFVQFGGADILKKAKAGVRC